MLPRLIISATNPVCSRPSRLKDSTVWQKRWPQSATVGSFPAGSRMSNSRSRARLLTALAAEGYDRLAEAMSGVDEGGGLISRGVAYVEFALACPSHFTVMFQPRLLHDDDAELAAARQRAWAALSVGVAQTRSGPDSDFGVAAWSLVHGYATLVLSGAVEPEDALKQARIVAGRLGEGAGKGPGKSD